jgi:hypothetical protein
MPLDGFHVSSVFERQIARRICPGGRRFTSPAAGEPDHVDQSPGFVGDLQPPLSSRLKPAIEIAQKFCRPHGGFPPRGFAVGQFFAYRIDVRMVEIYVEKVSRHRRPEQAWTLPPRRAFDAPKAVAGLLHGFIEGIGLAGYPGLAAGLIILTARRANPNRGELPEPVHLIAI